MSKKTVKSNREVKKEYFVDKLISDCRHMTVTQKISTGLIGIVLSFAVCSKGLEFQGIEVNCDKGGPKIINYNTNSSAWKGERKPTNPYTTKGVLDTTQVDSSRINTPPRDHRKRLGDYLGNGNQSTK